MYVRMTSQCCNSRWIYIHGHEVALSLLGLFLGLPLWQSALLAVQAASQAQRALYMPTHVQTLLKTCCQMSKQSGQQACEHMRMFACMNVCVYICFSPSSISTTSGDKVTTPSAPGMRPDGLCGRQENITLKCVESARGTAEYSCVCVCVYWW